MAGCDYYSCDICGAKTFYDAEVEYYDTFDKQPYYGEMAVICTKCAETHSVVIIKKETNG